MSLARLLKWIGLFTFIALVYIHMQMKIIHLAYQGKTKEQTIRHLRDANGYLTYDILSLKSANHLGVRMLSDDSKMEFIDSSDIMFISTPTDMIEDQYQAESVARLKKQKTNPFMSFLNFGTQAEAKGFD